MSTIETTPPPVSGPRTYGNWTRPKSPGLLGLGSIGTGVLFVGTGVTIIVAIAADLLTAFTVVIVTVAFLLLVAVRDKHGQSMFFRTLIRLGWASTRASRRNLYRSGPLGRTDWGSTQLPGLAAGSRLTEWRDSYQRPFALIHVPATSHYTVVIGSEPDGSSLVDREQVDTWVADWGMWLANIADEPGLEAVSVTVETGPDTGSRLQQMVKTSVTVDAPDFAKHLLDDIVVAYPSGAAVVRAYIAVTFNAAARPGGRRRTLDEMGRELASRIPGLTQSLSATGAGAVYPLGARELCEVIRVAFDPAAAALIDEANTGAETHELTWPDVGPTAHHATWDSYRHDSATSVTWMMSTAPRGNVPSTILARLLAPHRDIARKRVTLLYRPIDAARAAAIVEADVRAANFNMSASDRPSARNIAGTRAAVATAAEEAAGAGLVNFGMLITATVTDQLGEADARAAIDNLTATARLRVRLVHGSQDSAFAAALPLGLVLPKHLQIPAEIRAQL